MADQQYLMIIGAMKAGTTSLFHILESHPDICGSFTKEPNYFCTAGADRVTIEDYDDLWPEAESRDYRYLMEASACYTKPPQSHGVAEAIKARGMKVKFIYCVRDPIERIQSQVNWAIKFSWFDPKASLTGPRYSEPSRYYKQLSAYLELFPKEDFHIVDFQELAKNPREVGAGICDFLGLPDAIDYATTEQVRNATKKETTAERFMLRNALANKVFKRLPYRVRRWLRESVLTKFPEAPKITIDPASERELRAALADDMDQFKDAFGVDVAKWGF